jgi:prophage tail gpP-like protein
MTAPAPDELTLMVNGRAWTGWTGVRLTRGVERMPSDFEVEVTEKYPLDAAAIDISPGQTCAVKLGEDLVLTGYVDRYTAEVSPEEHRITISGRSKSEDMVDCSAERVTGQFSSTTLSQLATDLAAPYGISVKALAQSDFALSQFNVSLTESAWDILERVSRYSGVVVYDDTDGSIIIATVGQTSAASGFVQGENVQSGSVAFTMDQRFATYIAVPMAVDNFKGISAAGGLVANGKKATDPDVRAGRQLVIISEQVTSSDPNFAQTRANWEKARRYGRSKSIKVVCDSWRDSAGKLWTPNTLAPVRMPALKLPSATWLVSEVTYTKSLSGGTTAEVVLMPPQAFSPEPINFYDFNSAIANSAPAPPAAGPQSPPAPSAGGKP